MALTSQYRITKRAMFIAFVTTVIIAGTLRMMIRMTGMQESTLRTALGILLILSAIGWLLTICVTYPKVNERK